jgi:hypothetical protein
MSTSPQPPRSRLLVLPQIGALLFLILATLAAAPASAQEVSISVDFRTTLEPHGRWTHHDRWGEVWLPAHEEKDWAPYTRGRWVYTDDWGWYWVSADEEADWGWVAFHYGRWVYDDDEGWIWIPGREWAPAWVTWRRGGQRIGWAPQPPDEIYAEIRDNPRYWLFVEPRDFVSVTLWAEVEPAWRHTELLQETVIVNRTVVVRERGLIIAVNPGIEPAIIAREIGEPIRTYEVRPRILAGTAEIKEAIEVRPGEAPGELKEKEAIVRETRTVIEPAKTEQPPKALAPDEKGRLGERPPRAAEGVAPGEEPGKKAEEPTEEPGKKAEEPSKAEEPGKKAEEPTQAEEPGKKAEEPTAEPDKKAEEPSKAEEPGKKAEEPTAEPDKKAEEPSKVEEPGRKAEEPTKAKEPGKKAEEPEGKAEQPGKKAEEPSKAKEPGKKAEEPGKAERSGKKAEEPSKAKEPGKKAEEPGKAEQPGKKAEEKGKSASGKKGEGRGSENGAPE